MRTGSRKDERIRSEIVSLLRRLLNDLEAGKIVRVALDLQAFIRELEEEAQEKGRDRDDEARVSGVCDVSAASGLSDDSGV